MTVIDNLTTNEQTERAYSQAYVDELKRHMGWHTGTPTEEGWYLLQYLNSDEYDVGRWDGNDFVIEENLPMVLTSHRSVAWQKIEPFKET